MINMTHRTNIHMRLITLKLCLAHLMSPCFSCWMSVGCQRTWEGRRMGAAAEPVMLEADAMQGNPQHESTQHCWAREVTRRELA